jgi:hypothetical protein
MASQLGGGISISQCVSVVADWGGLFDAIGHIIFGFKKL